MNTTGTKSEKQRSSFSKVVLMEYLSAGKGQHSYTVLYRNDDGSKQLLGRIYREYNPDMKRNIYSIKDPQGNLLFDSTENLYQLKKEIKAKAEEIVKSIPAPEKIVPARTIRQSEQKQVEEKGEKKSIGKTIKDKAQELTHSLVEPQMNSEDPAKDSMIEEIKRKHELKEVRNEKENGKNKSKGLSR
ncbi:MAG: hypothetical protein EPN85_07030 [Bacteroidetes bacterium]|nr:MAG: hypothetical protein EPN85_07030 [Bacteroidota bacterium]